MSQPSVVLIMAGGTGGHIMPGLAVADELRERGWSVSWLGNPSKMEGRIVPLRGYELLSTTFSGVRGKGILAKIKAPFQLLGAMVGVWRHFVRIKPSVVLGMGGYVALPGGLIAWLRGVPLCVHEQNAIAGMTNRVLAKFARLSLTGFPGAIQQSETVGNPVRGDLLKLVDPADRYQERTGPLRILVLGGSLGASALNKTLPAAFALIPEAQRPVVTHQAGEQHLQALVDAYLHAGVEADCVAFIEDMASAIAQADLLICRAGAMTVAEVAAAGVAALFVPFPYAVDDHQTANARFLTKDQSAWLVQQDELSPQWLIQWLSLRSRDELAQVAQRARAHTQPRSAQRIADVCEQLAKGRI
jgi:UDP-N-acetylglucosamine--N-acetylmuramyl-(pentapeptide) pyrophosphoryl-undecaprenol N-acetylglucosamine transferase